MTLLHQLRCALPPHAWFFIDVTASVHWASQTIEVNAPRHYFSPTNNQSMGWAIPAAIGAQRLAPNHPVACVTGDGCFLMAAMELTTAARMNLPVKVFVLDDGAYHYMQMLQEPSFGRTTATQLAHLDYAAFARACGLAYLCIPSSDHIPRGVHSALHTPGPVLVQVKISYDGRPIRWLQALRSSYLDRLSTSEKTRLAARAITRAPNPLLQND
jgi:acetolactate synthase-1/2/3 large subunit